MDGFDVVDVYVKSNGTFGRGGATCPKCGGTRRHNKVDAESKKRGWYCRTCNNSRRIEWYRKDPRSIMALSAKQRASEKGLPFAISARDIHIPMVCPVLGIPLKIGTRKDHDNAPTLDRIIPELGYVAGNVVVISYRANRFRNDASASELEKVLAYSQTITKLQVCSDTSSSGCGYVSPVPSHSV